MSEHHCCQCDKEKYINRARMYAADKQRLLPMVGKHRVDKCFAWLPIRCPLTNKWYWLHDVLIIEVSYIKMGDNQFNYWMPYLAWKTEEVFRLKEEN